MRHFAFITRHNPTPAQTVIAARANIKLTKIPDRDAFTTDLNDLIGLYDGIICVHPVTALKAHEAGFVVGVWESALRAPENSTAAQAFEAIALRIYAGGKCVEVCR
jgi:hypothetical protein